MAEITKEAPDYIPAWIRQAEIALAEQRYDDCESLLNNALAHDTDNYDALFLRARMYLARGKVDKGVTELSRLSALYDQSPEVFYQLGVAEAATNASTALPPSFSARRAVMVASRCEVAAMPFSAWTGERPGRSKARNGFSGDISGG